MLLDPLEEQLDLPAGLVESGNGLWRMGELVGEEDEGLVSRAVLEADAPEMGGIEAVKKITQMAVSSITVGAMLNSRK